MVDTCLVAGERRSDLVRALTFRNRVRLLGNGQGLCEFQMPIRLVVPLRRALMRIEAEMLVHEADQLTRDSRLRTAEERLADAFLELIRRLEGPDG